MIKKLQLILVSILVALAVSCSKKEKPDYLRVPANEIRIGALLSLTGDGNSTGQSTRVSLALATSAEASKGNTVEPAVDETTTS